MSQRYLTVVPFLSKDWQKLEKALYNGPVNAHLSDPRNGFGILSGQQVRTVPVNNDHEEERIIEIVEECGLMVSGKVQKQYVLVEYRGANGKRQNYKALRNDITERVELKSYFGGVNHIYAHENFYDQVKALIEQHGFELTN